MCGDVTNWDEETYRETILKDREIQTRTVFRTAWAPSQNPNPDSIVVASSDGSLGSYSISSIISDLGTPKLHSIYFEAEPECFLQGHEGPLYDVKFYGDGEDALFLSCGDDGRIRGWRWKDCTESYAPIPLQGKHMRPVLDLAFYILIWYFLITVFSFSSHVIVLCRGPCIAVNTLSGSIYAAAGDSCAYCWDVDTGQVKMVYKGHSDYLHSITARNSTNQIITGSEDGTARIWEEEVMRCNLDYRSGKCIQVIEPGKEMKLKGHSSYVGCISLDASESWLACGSGRSLSVWNLPASECISKISTSASVQDVVFDENQILAVVAELLLNRFNINGEILSQIQCAPQSAFSVSLHPSGPLVVMEVLLMSSHNLEATHAHFAANLNIKNSTAVSTCVNMLLK
ncbi:hypothetical protein F8388_001887, partial [Cannabis sativa]